MTMATLTGICKLRHIRTNNKTQIARGFFGRYAVTEVINIIGLIENYA